MAAGRCWCCLWATLPLLLLLRWQGLLVAAEQVALVEVFLEQRPDVSALLQGEVVESSGGSGSSEDRKELEGELVLVSRVALTTYLLNSYYHCYLYTTCLRRWTKIKFSSKSLLPKSCNCKYWLSLLQVQLFSLFNPKLIYLIDLKHKQNFQIDWLIVTVNLIFWGLDCWSD